MPQRFAHWQRRLAVSDRPAYLLIADLIAEDLRSGRLSARERLPPLRELATLLDLNYTTVARAYAEARKRGLIDSRPGLGTLVKRRSPALPLRGGSAAEMTMNLPPEPHDPALLARLRETRPRRWRAPTSTSCCATRTSAAAARTAMPPRTWLRQRLPQADAARMLVAPASTACWRRCCRSWRGRASWSASRR